MSVRRGLVAIEPDPVLAQLIGQLGQAVHPPGGQCLVDRLRKTSALNHGADAARRPTCQWRRNVSSLRFTGTCLKQPKHLAQQRPIARGCDPSLCLALGATAQVARIVRQVRSAVPRERRLASGAAGFECLAVFRAVACHRPLVVQAPMCVTVAPLVQRHADGATSKRGRLDLVQFADGSRARVTRTASGYQTISPRHGLRGQH